MSAIRAATVLALWGPAYAGGSVPPDDLISALGQTGYTAGVRAAEHVTAEKLGLPGPGSPGAGTLALLDLFRPAGPCELVLPVAGDVRGLPAGHRSVVAALDAGAAVVLRSRSAAVVPVDGHWRVFDLGEEPYPSHPAWTVHEAEFAIDRAIVSATNRLRALDIARDSRTVRDDLAAAMREAAHDSPHGMPRRASALLAKVISLEALLQIAGRHQTAAVSRHELGAIDDALRPLAEAVRQGRLAAVAECAPAPQRVGGDGAAGF
ncbi:hypothetical protein D1871_16345 [Nakamurella silvestris]|nr:hypothetical protein D1871_16345 [Nakamurella silvestris]